MNDEAAAAGDVPPAEGGARPVVFLGPSMPLHEARRIVDADFRPPCRRGDIAELAVGTVVGLIDGVFHQDDAVSPRELVFAIERGVTILGSSSMGALRAAEVPGITGIGRVFEMYATSVIDSDDEVALLFDPDTFTAQTVPLVNVRYAVDRLVRAKTIDADIGTRVVDAARALHYRDRSYPRIVREAGLSGRSDAVDLIALLESFDLKRDDARRLLEQLPAHVERARVRGTSSASAAPRGLDFGPADGLSAVRAPDHMDPGASSMVWEIGGAVPFEALVHFLTLTGRVEGHARSAMFRFFAAGGSLKSPGSATASTEHAVKDQLAQICRTWGWNTKEEIHVTLNDLGMGFKDLVARLRSEVLAMGLLGALLRDPPDAFLKALRAELLMDDLALKRETMRFVSLERLAERGGAAPAIEAEQDVARRVVCRLQGGDGWAGVRRRLVGELGVSEPQLERFVHTVAAARRAASELFTVAESPSPAVLAQLDASFGIEASPKHPGDPRFTTPVDEAYAHSLRLRELVGVTRVGMITRLSELDGFHVSQAARPSGAWSSSYGSGKSTSERGAVVGAVMEETEKWAQEKFLGNPQWSSYARLREQARVLEPRLLDLPYDSPYHEDLELAWHECTDLLSAEKIFVPLAAIACSFNAGKNNVLFSSRGARVTFSTNGLASGFTLAEALVHGTCEYIERHAVRMAELRVENPGTSSRERWPRRIERETLPGFVQELIGRIERLGFELGLWDVTSEVRVPTVYARLVRDQELARGWASHPNPAVAVQMALLEAGQTVVAAIAAGREDLIVKARSLGRHERSNPLRGVAQAYWDDVDAPTIALTHMDGIVADDARTELDWLRLRLREGGISRLIAVDLSRDEMRPARAVRVLVPGLETNNPYYTGPRAQAALLVDMLPSRPVARVSSTNDGGEETMLSKAHRASLLVQHSNPAALGQHGVSREIYAQIYEGGAPWDVGRPQPAIVELEAQGKIRGPVLDVGCGRGDITLFLAAKGHEVLGIDFVEPVVAEARVKAEQQGVRAELLVFDALELSRLGRRFQTVIDSATFHTFSDEHRARYAKELPSVLEPDGVLYLLCFSDREPYRGGPRHVSEQEIRACFADGWDVVSLHLDRYQTTIVPEGALAWLAEIRRTPIQSR